MTSHNHSFERALRQGTRLLHARRTQEAIELLKQAHALQPDHLDAGLNLAGAFILAGKFREAIPLLEDLAQRDGDNPAVWINMGAAYLGNPILATGEQQLRAISCFERALELDPEAKGVHYNIGLIQRDRGEKHEAITMFQGALAVDPADPDARRLLERLQEAVSWRH